MDTMTLAAREALADRIRRRNPELSKRKILDAAEKAFAMRGFGGARLRDIAQQAGVHHALVHHYFSDKRGLFEEVIRRGLSRIEGLSGLRVAADIPIQQTLGLLVDPLYDFFADNRDLLRAIEAALRDKEGVPFEIASTVLRAQFEPLINELQREIGAAQVRGEVRNDLSCRSLLLFGLSVLMAPFVVGAGLSQTLGLPRPGDGMRAVAKAEIVALLQSAVAPQS